MLNSVKQIITVIFTVVIAGVSYTQPDFTNLADVRIGYGGIDGFSDMTFLSAAYGKKLKRGFIIRGSYLKGSGINEYSSQNPQPQHVSIDIFGISLQKAVNTSGASSINLALGYRYIILNNSLLYNPMPIPTGIQFNGSISSSYKHGVDVDLSYKYKFNDRFGLYLGANFTTAIFMFSVNAGGVVYF